MATITSANSVLTLVIPKLFPVPQTIQGFAADDAFMADAVDMAEVVMGVDGKLSAGFVFNPVKMTITIMPTSPSMAFFETWINTQKAQREVYPADGVIMMRSIGRTYALKNGYLTSAKQMPDNKKLLSPMPFSITWELVTGAAL
jgi:hypothetical protein